MAVFTTVNESQLITKIRQTIADFSYTDDDYIFFGGDTDAQIGWDGDFPIFAPASSSNMWSNCPADGYADPSLASHFFDDFFRFKEADGSERYWNIDGTNVGTIAVTSTADKASNGVIIFTNNAADDDMTQMQWLGEAWDLESTTAGKKIWFEARVQLSDATQSDAIIGLCITDSTLIAGLSDGVYFHKDDGDTNWDFATEKDSTATETAGIATADTSWVKLGFYYDGVGNVTPYVDGTAGTAHTANIPDDEQLTISFALQNGEAAAKNMYVDYVKVVQER